MTDAKFSTYLSLNHIVLLIKKNFELLDPFLSHFFKCYSTNLPSLCWKIFIMIPNTIKIFLGTPYNIKWLTMKIFPKFFILSKKLVWTFSWVLLL